MAESYDRYWPANRCSKVEDEEIFFGGLNINYVF
jgi:hypothetical protein